MGEPFNGKRLNDERSEFLEQTRQARQKRVDDQKKLEAALTIQRVFRVILAKRAVRKIAIEQFQALMLKFSPETNLLVNSRNVFQTSNVMMKFCKDKVDSELLEKLCRYVIWSMGQATPQYSYIGCGFNKETAMPWIQHLKDLLVCCLQSMTKLKPELVSDSKRLSLFLTTLVSLTSLDRWQIFQGPQFAALVPGMKKLNFTLFSHMKTQGKFFQSLNMILEAGLARPGKFFLKKANLLAVAKMTNRSVMDSDDLVEEGTVIQYVYHILTVPAYFYYVESMCPEGFDYKWLTDIIDCLSEATVLVENDLSKALSLLANLIQLGQCCGNLNEQFHPKFAKAIVSLLKTCGKHSNCSKKSHWHPLLGWVDHPVPSSLLNAASAVKTQIEYLWGPIYLEAIFYPLTIYLREMNMEVTEKDHHSSGSPTSAATGKTGFIKGGFVKAFRKVMMMDNNEGRSSKTHQINFGSEVVVKVGNSCELFSNIISTFSICRLDVLTGICFKQSSKWLVSLWKFLMIFGKDVKPWEFTLLTLNPTEIEFFIAMFSDAMIHFITMLDDQEMYEDQHAFKLTDLAKLAQFINLLCYRLLNSINSDRLRTSTFGSLKTLLMVLYRRDCRKKYCPDNHWLIDGSKMTHLIVDIDRGRKGSRKVLVEMPHVLREDARVILFRKWAASEKTLNGNSSGENDLVTTTAGSTLITIQRGRIVEDGYAQLASLSPKALKGTIRVRFQNELGLDEAGIDQDGVFKEFLEETINSVFNPSLNLFKGTNENLLYPSPLSYLHDNHLQLFEFVGKMLAKAIYEGIVVDVHFATFFLSQILGYQQNALFSAIDELQSLDRELYSSLNYIKHYEGNVEDLELTFSVDQDCLGEIRTTELIPGGRSIAVTNQNKISYLYLMAHFHLYLQIKEQTAAFLKGFRSILPNEWIRIFSPLELQRLISGEDTDIDLKDLRRNTQYYGGFHDNHRVVVWLWEIMHQDFAERERRLFLKFVTSCSKPPLLGFTNLDPPFSIRCVEVSDDEDTGDTIGSVLRGFLTIGKKDPVGRLPTSSTCFNLLKLPNYQKKSTLREKLRYAITANVGFELS